MSLAQLGEGEGEHADRLPALPEPVNARSTGLTTAVTKRSAGSVHATLDHPIRAGGVKHLQQLLKYSAHCRPTLRVMHRCECSRREPRLDLLQADRGIHQELNADISGCERHEECDSAFRVPWAGHEASKPGRGPFAVLKLLEIGVPSHGPAQAPLIQQRAWTAQ